MIQRKADGMSLARGDSVGGIEFLGIGHRD